MPGNKDGTWQTSNGLHGWSEKTAGGKGIGKTGLGTLQEARNCKLSVVHDFGAGRQDSLEQQP